MDRASSAWSPTTCFFLVAFVLVWLRLMYQASYFPPYFAGEEARILDAAETIRVGELSSSPSQPWLDSIQDYQKGYTWLAYPLYRLWGYDLRIVIWGVPLLVALFSAGFFALYKKVHGAGASIYPIILCVTLALFTVSVRRYKWHTVSYATVVCVYLFFLDNLASGPQRATRLKWIAATGFLVTCFFYFGNTIYLIPAVVLSYVLDVRKKPGSDYRRFCAILCGSVLIIGSIYYFSAPSVSRLRFSEADMLKLSQPGVISWRLETVRKFFLEYLSLPTTALFLVGVGIAVVRVKRGDRFALVTLTILVWTMGLQFLIEGISNPDWLNWSMLPMMGVILLAGDALIKWGQKMTGRPGAWGSGGMLLLCAFIEFRSYPILNVQARHQMCMESYNTATQLSLILRAIQQDGLTNAVYYLPAPSIAESEGGFAFNDLGKRTDLKAAFTRVRFYASLGDLSQKLSAEDRGQQKTYAFFSVSELDREQMSKYPAICGVRPELIVLFENVYLMRFPVVRYQF